MDPWEQAAVIMAGMLIIIAFLLLVLDRAFRDK